MKILILGSGIAGICSAYVLGARGHEVTVIDEENGPAMETSFANGGQLSYSHCQPWANPGVPAKLPKWLMHEDSPLVFRLSADPQMILWGMRFLWNCRRSASMENSATLFRIGAYSRLKLAEIRDETNLEFDYAGRGILHVFSHHADYGHATQQHAYEKSLGSDDKIVSREECFQIEPALRDIAKPLVGGIYSPSDESGDVHIFCEKLAEYCTQKFKTEFVYGTSVLKIKEEGGKVSSVATTKGDFSADIYIAALGSYTPKFVKPLGVNVPVYPMKGYSITVPAWEGAPEVSITDDEKKIVFSRLGNRMRAAGTAEFAGYNHELRETRIEPIIRCMKELFPKANTETISKWACLRPQTPDGPPIIGRTKVSNLFLHTGHGTLGWTQAAGTAHLLADIIEKRPTEISLKGLELHRYG